jgi:hydroperoxy icosatetraenoate dehydratase/isomerase
MSDSETDFLAKGPVQEATDWPVIQASNPRKAQYFLFGNACGCCPPWIFLALIFGVIGYVVGFVTLVLACAAALALYVCCGYPLCTVFCYFRDWDCTPWYWAVDIYLKATYLGFQAVLLSRKNPNATEEFMPVEKIRPKEVLEKSRIPYALNIQVPLGSAEEFTDDPISASGTVQLGEQILSALPMTDDFQAFEEGEDPVAYIMNQLSSVYPYVYQKWEDKQSDTALSRFCLYGLGAHRVEKVEKNGVPYYCVKTNQLSGLPMREGFERYGGDAYFDMNWRVVMICDQGLGEWSDNWIQPEIVTKPTDPGWERAKFRFRSTLSVLVTLVDHLYGVHLQTANIFVTAIREQLSADHPMRRFMTPFTFQTISVNNNARTNLAAPRAIAPRCFGFTDAGMSLAFAAAPSLLKSGLEVSDVDGGPLINRETYYKWLQKQGIDTEYFRQSAMLFKIMKQFVEEYLAYYYPSHQAVVEDAEMTACIQQTLYQLAFVTPGEVVGQDASKQFSKATESEAGRLGAASNPAMVEALYQKYVDVFAYTMFLVTAGHEQVGSVEVYVQDVSFCAFKWVPGALIGTKQTASAQGLLMSLTSTPMPKLLDSVGWTHLFPPPKTPPLAGVATADQSFWTFQKRLRDMAAYCDDYNAKANTRPFPNNFPMYVLNPSLLETSISV